MILLIHISPQEDFPQRLQNEPESPAFFVDYDIALFNATLLSGIYSLKPLPRV